MAAKKKPKKSEEEKNLKKEKMQGRLKKTIKVPLSVMRISDSCWEWMIEVAKVGNISSETDDKKNLIDYFIKIPLNVYKGIQGCYGKVGTNEEINNWSKSSLNFNVKEYQVLARNNNAINSLANATWATQEVMHYFDSQKNIFNIQESDGISIEKKMKKNKDKYESLNY